MNAHRPPRIDQPRVHRWGGRQATLAIGGREKRAAIVSARTDHRHGEYETGLQTLGWHSMDNCSHNQQRWGERSVEHIAAFREQLCKTISGREIGDFHRESSALGGIEGWPRSLTRLVSTMLDCPNPMLIAWGPEPLAFFNDAFRPILGERVAGAMGRPIADLWRDILSGIGPLADQPRAGGRIEMTDMRLALHRFGIPEESWWIFTYSRRRDDHYQLDGVLCGTTERPAAVRSERAPRHAAAQLQSAFHAGDPIGAWDWDVVNDRVTVDERFALIYNVDPSRAAEGVCATEFLACVHPDDLPLVQSGIEATLRFGDDYYAEYRIVGGNGTVQWVSARGNAVFDEHGKCIRFLGLSFDISLNKIIEKDRHTENMLRLQ